MAELLNIPSRSSSRLGNKNENIACETGQTYLTRSTKLKAEVQNVHKGSFTGVSKILLEDPIRTMKITIKSV